ncbi:hypothetical protein [uncultured Shimia sp.]|uniref:hypothetical protein n=1 Tax=uncultured Shimia sp. TaxID=573152 RepID=UPI002613CFBA|nr:hypothetical protein [uncultured Shimia sp.]
MNKTSHIWVDLDAYCVEAFDFEANYVFGRAEDGSYPNGVLRLPPDSETLAHMTTFVTSPNPTQPWRGARLHRLNKARVDRGETWGIEALPWGCSGPKALTYFLEATGEDKHALPNQTFYPLSPAQLGQLHDPRVPVSDIERVGVYSVHIYGHQKRVIATRLGGVPLRGSYLDRLCQRHEINPTEHPVKAVGWLAL